MEDNQQKLLVTTRYEKIPLEKGNSPEQIELIRLSTIQEKTRAIEFVRSKWPDLIITGEKTMFCTFFIAGGGKLTKIIPALKKHPDIVNAIRIDNMKMSGEK